MSHYHLQVLQYHQTDTQDLYSNLRPLSMVFEPAIPKGISRTKLYPCGLRYLGLHSLVRPV